MISEVFNIDCMEYMKTLPDKFFDLAIVDPPYGIGYENGGQYFNKNQGKKWDYIPSQDYFSELKRISANQIIWGGNYFQLPPSRCVIAWIKTIELQNRTFSEWEMAWSSFDSIAKYYECKPFIKNGSRIHPTQKPVALYSWLLKNYAKTGDKIFDSHMGSQSSRIACHRMGFDFWGCELDKDYFEQGNARFERETRQELLFKL